LAFAGSLVVKKGSKIFMGEMSGLMPLTGVRYRPLDVEENKVPLLLCSAAAAAVLQLNGARFDD